MRSRSERPLRRSIIKILAQVMLGKSRAHAQNAWPGLKLDIPLEEGAAGEVTYRGARIAPLLHPAHLRAAAGSEINIIGSGPSIRDNDVSGIASGSAILLNGAISLLGGDVEKALAVAIEDERFVWRHFSLMREKIRAGTICLFSPSVMRAICELDSGWLSDKHIILIDDIRKPYGGARRHNPALAELPFARLSDDGTSGFSDDPARGVFQGGSVAISALQFAIFCRPQRIGLFGIDISNADTPRFYETAGDTARSGVARAKERILGHVALAKTVCEERGIELLNFSAVSALGEIGLPYDGRFAARKGGN